MRDDERQIIGVRLAEASASRALVEVSGLAAAAKWDVSGVLRGPMCQYARTLPAAYQSAVDATGQVTFAVPEPCYWTPELPFLYRLTLEWKGAGGTAAPFDRTVGLRGLYCRRRDLMLESKRFVLRGGRANRLDIEELPLARKAETALVVDDPSDELCEAASLKGVLLLADLRSVGELWLRRVEEFAWMPAVAMALVSAEQLRAAVDGRDGVKVAIDVPVAQVVDCSAPASVLHEAANVVAMELAMGERPPDWIAAYGKPVLAMCRGGAEGDYREMRASCDRLQAELAPEFDLAGYFV